MNLFPLEGWQSSHFTVDQPVTSAAALVLLPVEAGLVSLLGGIDSRELHGRITLSKAVFNRTGVSLTTYAGSWAVHHLFAAPSTSVRIVPAVLLVLGVELALNYPSVAIAISLEHGYSVVHVLKQLRLGKPVDYAFTLLAGALLGAMLAMLSKKIPSWALLAFTAPILLGRQVLIRSEMFIQARRAMARRQAALAELNHRISEERLDERRLIAADLHDEVLQPLFQITLMAQVLKMDMSSGRLLELDQDLPELLNASETAVTALRELIGDLRKSALGRGGLAAGLTTLVRSLQAQTAVLLHHKIESVSADPEVELITYQVAKESLTNAIRHSRAQSVEIDLAEDESGIHLTVSDDGVGFDPSDERECHYGLQIMQERVESVSGHLFLDTSAGRGCRVIALLPGRAASHSK